VPYTAPPTFSTGAILTAAQLNILSDDIEHINSLTDFINLPFSTYTYGIGGVQSMSEVYWVIRHRHRYLHYYLTVDTSTITANLHLDVNWGSGWNTVFSTASGLAAPSTITGYADLNSLGIPTGSFMQVRWDALCNGLSTNRYFAESSFTSI